jgi:WD40 repeat protein
MSRALFAAFVLLADAGASHGEGAKTDLYGDPLPPGAVARLGTMRLRHAQADVVFSKDGKRLISCGCGGEVRTWDAATGKLLRRQKLAWKPGEAHELARIALSPDGATAAAWNGQTAYIYETHTGSERGSIPVSTTLNFSLEPLLRFSPDGKLLVLQVSDDENLATQIWDVVELKNRQTLRGHDRELDAVAFTPDGKRLLGRDGGKLFLWDVRSGAEIVNTRDQPVPRARGLAFAPDGKTLVVGSDEGDGRSRLLDAANLQETGRQKALAAVTNICDDRLLFSPDGRFLAGASEADGRSVFISDMTGAKKLQWLPGWHVFAFSPDSKALVYSNHEWGKQFRLWDAGAGRPMLDRPGHDWPVTAMAVSTDGKRVVSVATDALYLWDAASGKLLRQWVEGNPNSQACLFSSDGKRLICAGCDRAVVVRDIASGKELQRFKADSLIDKGMRLESVRFPALGLSTDGKCLTAIVTAGEISAKLYVWDLDSGKRLREAPYKLEERIVRLSRGERGPRGYAHAALSPGAEVVSVWREGRVALEEVVTGVLLASLPEGVGGAGHGWEHWGRAIAFSPDGQLVTAAILKPAEGEHREGEYDCKGVALIEAATGEEVYRLGIGDFDHVAFTSDGRGVLVADKRGLRVWDAITGERLNQMEWPQGIADRVVDRRGEVNVCSLTVLPGNRVVTGMIEGDILIWDLATAKWPAHKPAIDFDCKELDALWSDLAGDAHKAHRAICTLVSVPARTIPFLKDHLRPAAVDTKRIEKLLADLDADPFETREAASQELAQWRYRAEPMLRRALDRKPSQEARRRLQAILAEPKRPTAEELRTLRAIAALERIGTPEARQVLAKLADGAEARETREAKAALERLKRLSN